MTDKKTERQVSMARQLRAAREAAGLLLKDVGSAADVHPTLIAEYERGERPLVASRIPELGPHAVHAVIRWLNEQLPEAERYELSPAAARVACPEQLASVVTAMRATSEAHSAHVQALADGVLDDSEVRSLIPLYEAATAPMAVLNGLRARASSDRRIAGLAKTAGAVAQAKVAR